AIAAGQALARRLSVAVLVKGGHLGSPPGPPGPPGEAGAEAAGEAIGEAVDALCRPEGVEVLRGPRIPGGEHVHGTGCALSSALATYLAHGLPLVDACRAAKQHVAERIAAPARPGRGAAAIV
ncbi:MAG TPA: bifunctional hydroxymethylpyrimidine kinase/phosphomethylpyrimidine kinase, partial [Kofleriaceae bacterium]|nr:bifunctional hydroxymethylpyrimidine kinase/phosphomethylpyrimidine kinase [Kofleriaceae bacterium]